MRLTILTRTLPAIILAVALSGVATHSKPCPDRSLYVPPNAEDFTSPVYVMVECLSGCYIWSMWIYAESNGEQGLQRHDDYCYHVDADGRGYTAETADTIIF